MSGFKLLGIRILEGCARSIRKSLKVNTFYKLNSDYEVRYLDNDMSKEIIDVFLNSKSEFSQSLYSIEDLDISISAIVGKNGSGKSSLLEIIYACSFLLGEKFKFIGDLKWKDKKNNPGHFITKKEEEIANDLFSLKEHALFEIYFSKGIEIFRIVNNGEERIHIQKKEINANSIIWNNFNDENLSDTFYTICVNYSLYGLNERGDPWLRSLFHKNDGYKTPLVINPYRTNGNIDVNRELHLSQTRTILNLSARKENSPEIVNGKIVSKIRFVMDVADNNHIINSKGISFDFKNVLKNQNNHTNLFELFNRISKSLCDHSLTPEEINELSKEKELDSAIDLINKFKSIPNANSRLIRVKYEMIKYTVRKVYKICAQYPSEYGEFIIESKEDMKRPPVIADFDGLIRKLTDDKSHITLKLRQILYTIFSKYFEKEDWYETPYFRDPSKVSIALDIDWDDFKTMIINMAVKYSNV